MSDHVTDSQGPEPDELEAHEVELLPDRAAMTVIRPPLPLPVVPIGGGGDTFEPPPIDYT